MNYSAYKGSATVKDIADTNLTPKQKAWYHAREVVKELKKENTDWDSVKYHQGQAKRWASVRHYLIPKKGN